MKIMIICLLVVSMVQVGFSAEKLYSGEPIKVMLVTGGGHHDYKTQAKIIPELLTSRGDFSVTVIGPDWEVAKKALKEPGWAKGQDIIIYNLCDAHNTDVELIKNICSVHLEEKKPAVMLHAAMHSFHWKMGKIKNRYEGEPWVKIAGMCSGNHGKHAPINVKNIKEEHAVMKKLPKEWTTPKGELYNSHEVLNTSTPLAKGTNTGDPNQGEQVCIWANDCDGVNVFATTLGHHNETMQDPIYGDMLVRGLLWALGKLK